MKIGDYEIQVPFVTTSVESVKDAIALAGLKGKERFVDLGSGDGRVVLEFAKHGIHADGFELKEPLVQKARQRILDARLTEKATIFLQSMWDADLSRYDIIYLYGMDSVMAKFEEKILMEANQGTKILSNVFRFSHLKLKKTKGDVALYIKQ